MTIREFQINLWICVHSATEFIRFTNLPKINNELTMLNYAFHSCVYLQVSWLRVKLTLVNCLNFKDCVSGVRTHFHVFK